MAHFARNRHAPDRSAAEPNRIAGGAEHYDVLDTLAHGSTADLLLAARRGAMGVDSLVILKRLRTSPLDDARSIDIFLQEARVSVRLRHANIVRTYSVGEDYGAPFLVMEYLEGESLRDLVRESVVHDVRLPPAIVVYMACETLKGLHHAHTLVDYEGRPLALVHRDVSPHNVFVSYDGTVKLIDFGTAKTTLATEHTAEGVVKGKVAYLSPEQALGKPLDPRTDVFSLGITLWEVLAMRRLMVGTSAFDTMLRILNTPAPRLSEVIDGIPPALDAIVARALERDPDRRFASAEEMRLALRDPECLGGPRAGAEELADAMTYFFREARARKDRAIAQRMAELDRGGPRMTIPGPPLTVAARTSTSVSGPEEVSLRFVGGSEPNGLAIFERSSRTTTTPPPDQSGERPSMPRSRRDATATPMAAVVATATPTRSLSGQRPVVLPPAPTAPLVPDVAPLSVAPLRKPSKLRSAAWLTADALTATALVACLAHPPDRERVSSAAFWRATGDALIARVVHISRDLLQR